MFITRVSIWNLLNFSAVFIKSLGLKLKMSYEEECVTMPWEDKTTIIYTEPSGEQIALRRWEVVKRILNNPIRNVDELINAIRNYSVQFTSDGTQVTPAWSFKVLRATLNDMEHSQQEEFFSEKGVLASICSLVLSTPKVCPKVPWLGQSKEANLKLHQMQVACILANSFLCTFPYRRPSQPSINFNTLFEGSKAGSTCRAREKLKCILHYFFRIHKKQPCGYLSFHRRVIEQQNYPRWNTTTVPLTALTVDAVGRIEDQPNHLQADFANRVLGGGVLGWGCVQEEIRFVICPELIATRLFSERMADNEAFIIIGAERFSNYKGYADSFMFDGDHDDATPFDHEQRRQTHILAVDATRFTKPQEQYRESLILREIKKIYTGLRPMSKDSVPLPLATGNWGCGAFRGDVELKSLIQLMAASQAGREVAYFTFGDEALRDNLQRIHALLLQHSVTVGLLYRTMTMYIKNRRKGQTVFQFVAESISLRKRTDLFPFLNAEELTAMEGGQKRKRGSPSSSWSRDTRPDSERKKSSPKSWVESEKQKTDTELSQQFTKTLGTQVADRKKEQDLEFPLSPTMFWDSEDFSPPPDPPMSPKPSTSTSKDSTRKESGAYRSIFDMFEECSEKQKVCGDFASTSSDRNAATFHPMNPRSNISDDCASSRQLIDGTDTTFDRLDPFPQGSNISGDCASKRQLSNFKSDCSSKTQKIENSADAARRLSVKSPSMFSDSEDFSPPPHLPSKPFQDEVGRDSCDANPTLSDVKSPRISDSEGFKRPNVSGRSELRDSSAHDSNLPNSSRINLSSNSPSIFSDSDGFPPSPDPLLPLKPNVERTSRNEPGDNATKCDTSSREYGKDFMNSSTLKPAASGDESKKRYSQSRIDSYFKK